MLLVPSLRIGMSAPAIFEFACFESVKLQIHNSDVTCNQYHGLGWHQFRMAFHQTKRKLQLADTCSSELTFVMCGGEGVELRANRPTTDPSRESPSQTKSGPGRGPGNGPQSLRANARPLGIEGYHKTSKRHM